MAVSSTRITPECFVWLLNLAAAADPKLPFVPFQPEASPPEARQSPPNYCRTRSDTLSSFVETLLATSLSSAPRSRIPGPQLPFRQEVRIMKRILKIVAIIFGVLI